jgi:hypothetical protein
MSESGQSKRDYIFGPRQAFQFVGEHCFGDVWDAACIDDAARPQHRAALVQLRDALRSGEVAAQWDTLDFRQTGDLNPLDVDGEFFRFILKDDLVFHPRLNEPVRCRISARDLDRLLKPLPAQTMSSSNRAEKECLRWLAGLFSSNDTTIPTKEALKVSAMQRFSGLSSRAFDRARLDAIHQTGRTDLSSAGRPKNRITP